jgi:hypothetical protein
MSVNPGLEEVFDRFGLSCPCILAVRALELFRHRSRRGSAFSPFRPLLPVQLFLALDCGHRHDSGGKDVGISVSLAHALLLKRRRKSWKTEVGDLGAWSREAGRYESVERSDGRSSARLRRSILGGVDPLSSLGAAAVKLATGR